MFNTPPRYRFYLLTVWEERNLDPNLPVTWRFSLEDARSRQRRGFADMASLMTAVERELVAIITEETNKAMEGGGV